MATKGFEITLIELGDSNQNCNDFSTDWALSDLMVIILVVMEIMMVQLILQLLAEHRICIFMDNKQRKRIIC